MDRGIWLVGGRENESQNRTEAGLLWWNIPILWLVRIVLVTIQGCIAFLQLSAVSCLMLLVVLVIRAQTIRTPAPFPYILLLPDPVTLH